MNKLKMDDVVRYVEDHIGDFHQQRISSIRRLDLLSVLRRKNPYLFRSKNVCTSEDMVRNIVDSHLSSNEETIFGTWLERLVIFISEKVCGGKKSGINGIDLEFDREGKRHIVAIKSGPNWGNSSQIKRLESDFKSAKISLRTSNSKMDIQAVNGCCYGRSSKSDKGDYLKLCGEVFWKYISGDRELYTKIIEPLGYKAKEKNEQFATSYSGVVNRFIVQFSEQFCDSKGEIEWNKLVRFNSSSKATQPSKEVS